MGGECVLSQLLALGVPGQGWGTGGLDRREASTDVSACLPQCAATTVSVGVNMRLDVTGLSIFIRVLSGQTQSEQKEAE